MSVEALVNNSEQICEYLAMFGSGWFSRDLFIFFFYFGVKFSTFFYYSLLWRATYSIFQTDNFLLIITSIVFGIIPARNLLISDISTLNSVHGDVR